MAELQNRHNPSFINFPVNNNRTGWQPVKLPVILAVPHSVDANYLPIDNSQPTSVAMIIEGAPTEALIAGYEHRGQRYPDKTINRVDLTISDLNELLIDPYDYEFSLNGNVISPDNLVEGCVYTYTTKSGVTDTISWYSDINYYDLSEIELPTTNLIANHYNLVYECNFYRRLITSKLATGLEEFVCIDTNYSGYSGFSFEINHPGEVLLDMVRLTPDIYLTSTDRSSDTTIKFYRVLAEALQNIYDEQRFIGSSNWISEINYAAIPYLSNLIGVDLPYYPESLDRTRKSILTEASKIFSYKGTQFGVEYLMDLLGFKINIIPVWYNASEDGFVVPNSGYGVEYNDTVQLDCLLSGYSSDSFIDLSIPLLYKPRSSSELSLYDDTEITIDVFGVVSGSDSDNALGSLALSITENAEDTSESTTDNDGFTHTQAIIDIIQEHDIYGRNQYLLENGSITKQVSVGENPPFNMVGQILESNIKYDKDTNTIVLKSNAHHTFKTDNIKLYAFATYKRLKYTIAEELTDNISNRFIVEILTKTNKQIDPTTLQFSIDLIKRLKAFHSIIYAIKYKYDIGEVYNVTDNCVGGDVTQRYDTDLGQYQVPPAIIPETTNITQCDNADLTTIGYKNVDLDYRRELILGLLAEFEAWGLLDGREPWKTNVPENNEKYQYNYLGQDRTADPLTQKITGSDGVPEDANDQSILKQFNLKEYNEKTVNTDNSIDGSFVNSGYEDRSTLITRTSGTDFKYKGRVSDILLTQLAQANHECINNYIGASQGSGVYWVSQNNIVRRDNTESGSMLIRLQNQTPNDLNYSNTYYDSIVKPALSRPSLCVEIPIMHFPGCRFATMGNLKNDYTHATWNAKPWDDYYNTCGSEPYDVSYDGNTSVTSDLDGTLFKVRGNGFNIDIPTYGSHSGVTNFENDDVVHKIYSSTMDNGHEAVELDDVFTLTNETLISSSFRLFNTAILDGTSYTDYIDGYPSVVGLFNYSSSFIVDDLLSAMGVPDLAETSDVELLFNYSSGILTGDLGYRNDYSCSIPGDLTTNLRTDYCYQNEFIENGELNFESDKLITVPVLKLVEKGAVSGLVYNGSISYLGV